MQKNLAISLAYIREDEGEELNISAGEPGHGSRFGVSITALSDYRKKLGLPPATIDDLKALTPATVDAFYTAAFAEPLRFNDLPGGVDYRLLDVSVNLGLTGGPNALQLALGMFPLTGVVDADTLAKVATTDPKALVMALSAAWIAVKHTSPNWNPSPITKTGYGKGWSARNSRATARAIAMIGT